MKLNKEDLEQIKSRERKMNRGPTEQGRLNEDTFSYGDLELFEGNELLQISSSGEARTILVLIGVLNRVLVDRLNLLKTVEALMEENEELKQKLDRVVWG